jgi:hypothetical protein
VIEGDFIHLRERAQQVISATTAAAKIAAATTSSASYSSLLPSVAVTPVAQNTRQKRGPAKTIAASGARHGYGGKQQGRYRSISEVILKTCSNGRQFGLIL